MPQAGINDESFSQPSMVDDISELSRVKTPDGKKTYIGCKIIRARPMTQDAFLKSQGKWKENQETLGDGYEVTYPDNYVSWSPKKVFEEAYREISSGEKALL